MGRKRQKLSRQEQIWEDDLKEHVTSLGERFLTGNNAYTDSHKISIKWLFLRQRYSDDELHREIPKDPKDIVKLIPRLNMNVVFKWDVSDLPENWGKYDVNKLLYGLGEANRIKEAGEKNAKKNWHDLKDEEKDLKQEKERITERLSEIDKRQIEVATLKGQLKKDYDIDFEKLPQRIDEGILNLLAKVKAGMGSPEWEVPMVSLMEYYKEKDLSLSWEECYKLAEEKFSESSPEDIALFLKGAEEEEPEEITVKVGGGKTQTVMIKK